MPRTSKSGKTEPRTRAGGTRGVPRARGASTPPGRWPSMTRSASGSGRGSATRPGKSQTSSGGGLAGYMKRDQSRRASGDGLGIARKRTRTQSDGGGLTGALGGALSSLRPRKNQPPSSRGRSVRNPGRLGATTGSLGVAAAAGLGAALFKRRRARQQDTNTEAVAPAVQPLDAQPLDAQPPDVQPPAVQPPAVQPLDAQPPPVPPPATGLGGATPPSA